MIFDDIGDESDIPQAFLGTESSFFVFLTPYNRFAFVPSVIGFAGDGFGKIKHGREVTIVSDKCFQSIRAIGKYFTYSKCLMFFECFCFHLMQKVIDTFRIMKHVIDACQPVITVCRIAGINIRLFNVHDCIDTEAGYTAIQPPVDHFVYFFPEFGILPVQIRLFFVKDMHVIFVGVSRQKIPYRTAEIRTPVVW